MMKSALITGVAGQDGSYLAKFLLDKGYNVYGLTKQRTSMENHKYLDILGKVTIIEGDITDESAVSMAIKVSNPDEIYNLAAQSHVGYSFKCPKMTCEVNYTGFLNVLLAARQIVPNARIYQAGTSEMFGYASASITGEYVPFQPKSPYAVAKVASHWAGVNARHEADQFVSNGILFNHESPLRHPDFVTKKITNGVNRLITGILGGNKRDMSPIKLGNIDSKRDWGYAGDYVEAMWMMLQHDKPDDFIVATGEVHSVREFLQEAFKVYKLEIRFEGSGAEEKGYVGDTLVMEVDSNFYRPNDLNYLRGDFSKINSVLGWKPKVGFRELVNMMVTR
jgi:GDPmannose 4,6-dehydratase